MPLKPISNPTEHDLYLCRVERDLDNGKYTSLTDIYAGLIERYEDEHYPIRKLTFSESVAFRLSQILNQ